MDKFPKVTAEFKNNEWQIKIENWDGMSAMSIEHLSYKMHKAAHQWRADRLHEMNVAVRKASGDAPVNRGTDAKFVEELTNALQQGKSSLAG